MTIETETGDSNAATSQEKPPELEDEYRQELETLNRNNRKDAQNLGTFWIEKSSAFGL